MTEKRNGKLSFSTLSLSLAVRRWAMCNEGKKWIPFLSQKRKQVFKGCSDGLHAEARTYGSKEFRAWVSLGTNGARQLGENGCGHAVASKMVAACEEHGMVEGRSGYCRLEGSSFLLILAEMGMKEDGFRGAEVHSWGWAGDGAASC